MSAKVRLVDIDRNKISWLREQDLEEKVIHISTKRRKKKNYYNT